MTKLFHMRVRIEAVRELAKSIFEIAYVIFLPSRVTKPVKGWRRAWFDIFCSLCYNGAKWVRKREEDTFWTSSTSASLRIGRLKVGATGRSPLHTAVKVFNRPTLAAIP